MKFLELCTYFYKKVIAPAVLLLLLMIVSQLSFVYFTGINKYCKYTEDKLTQSRLENSVYAMSFNELMSFDSVLQDAVAAMPGVEHVYGNKSFMGISVNSTEQAALFYDDHFMRFITLEKNNTFSATGLSDGKIQCIGLGEEYAGSKINDVLTISKADGTQIEAVLIDKVEYPYYYPSLNALSSVMTSDEIFTVANGSSIIIKDCGETRNLLGVGQNLTSSPCCFVKFQDGATAEEIEHVKETFYKQNYVLTEYEELLQNTRKATEKKLAEHLPVPLYMMVTVTVSFICMGILFVYKKMGTHVVYYLCGCSRRKSFCISACALGFIGLAASLISCIVILLYTHYAKYSNFFILYCIIDERSTLSIFAFLLVNILIAVLIPLFMQRQKTILEMKGSREL